MATQVTLRESRRDRMRRLVGDVDPVDLILEGADQIEDETERYRSLLSAAETLRNPGSGRSMAERIERHVASMADHLANDLRICPSCGDDLTEREIYEKHPYGATYAMERHVVLECPLCGEV